VNKSPIFYSFLYGVFIIAGFLLAINILCPVKKSLEGIVMLQSDMENT